MGKNRFDLARPMFQGRPRQTQALHWGFVAVSHRSHRPPIWIAEPEAAQAWCCAPRQSLDAHAPAFAVTSSTKAIEHRFKKLETLVFILVQRIALRIAPENQSQSANAQVSKGAHAILRQSY